MHEMSPKNTSSKNEVIQKKENHARHLLNQIKQVDGEYATIHRGELTKILQDLIVLLNLTTQDETERMAFIQIVMAEFIFADILNGIESIFDAMAVQCPDEFDEDMFMEMFERYSGRMLDNIRAGSMKGGNA